MEIPLSLANSEARIPSRPQSDLEAKGEINFLHPGYAAPNTLLRLARTDCEKSNGKAVFGIHHETALLACQIIANNAFHSGYFTLDSAGLERVDVPLDGLLTKGRYYFHIDGIDQYPVVPSFRDWKFPHGDIEIIWPTLPSTNFCNSSVCSLSGFSYAVNGAHIIPREEDPWFTRNEMSFDGDINTSSNIIPLRKDLHKCFDDRWFVIIPKPTSSGTRYVTHILLPRAAQIWPNFHNIELQCFSQLYGRRFLFARFAWAILQQVKPFIITGVPRKVIQCIINDSGEMEYPASDIGGLQLKNLYAGGGSKTATPLKRKLSSANFDCEQMSSDNSDMDPDECFDDFTSARDRRMQSSSDTPPDCTPMLPADVRKELESSVADLIASQNLREVNE